MSNSTINSTRNGVKKRSKTILSGKNSFVDLLRYRFDNFMSHGSIALIIGLGLISLLMIVGAAGLITLFGFYPEGKTELPFLEVIWQSMMRSLDPGTMGHDSGWGFRLVMFGVTLGGIFVFSTLIGLLTNTMHSQIEYLRRGRSRVMEKDHTVILGWSPAVFTIIHELMVANSHHDRSCVVIMGERDKTEMEQIIR